MSPERRRKDLVDRAAAVQRVALLPPQVKVWELGFNDDLTRLRDLETRFGEQVMEYVAAHLGRLSLAVQPARLEPSDLQGDRELSFQLTELFQSYDQLSWRLYRGGDQQPSATMGDDATIGPAICLFGGRAGVEALVFTRFVAFSKSTAMRGKDTFFRVLAALGGVAIRTPSAAATVEVALIDSQSGEALWVNRASATYTGDIDVDFVVAHAMYPLPRDIFSGPDPPAAAVPDNSVPSP